ncbi:hypothetical protein B4125_0639 [Bacillus paralicheniformis]|nr:hypothetical protein B4125_0639 [Bacillus paralicheniformis]TWK27878.1 hypothetical protein CHCC20372_3129 [Bacillus paralicheniformis]TWM01209.1 hypothetical protein CHCC15136_4561 [Bacillus paralicheniformis]TWM42097.1 hypothetical protein CHCC14817_3127 [Bacillus paralicheniformis]TWN64705.1 hypothetical protein CHCC12620_0404 [Bacillus paralicheniformis]
MSAPLDKIFPSQGYPILAMQVNHLTEADKRQGEETSDKFRQNGTKESFTKDSDIL